MAKEEVKYKKTKTGAFESLEGAEHKDILEPHFPSLRLRLGNLVIKRQFRIHETYQPFLLEDERKKQKTIKFEAKSSPQVMHYISGQGGRTQEIHKLLNTEESKDEYSASKPFDIINLKLNSWQECKPEEDPRFSNKVYASYIYWDDSYNEQGKEELSLNLICRIPFNQMEHLEKLLENNRDAYIGVDISFICYSNTFSSRPMYIEASYDRGLYSAVLVSNIDVEYKVGTPFTKPSWRSKVKESVKKNFWSIILLGIFLYLYNHH